MADKLLIEESKKRFQQILEYIDMQKTGYIEEADDDQDNGQGGPDMGGGMPPMDGGQGGPDMGGGMPPMDGGQGGPDMGGAPAPDGGGQSAPEGFDPQLDPNMNGPMDGGMGPNMDGGMQPDDEVVDVSDLTDSMEDTEKEVEGLNNKFSEVLGAVKSLEALIKHNDERINDLKADFEKRNPSQIEKLSMQTARSYPFNVTPEEYWAEKEKNSNYSTEDDNNGVGQGQYVITKDDVNGNVDWKSIADTMDDKLIFNQSLNNLLKY